MQVEKKYHLKIFRPCTHICKLRSPNLWIHATYCILVSCISVKKSLQVNRNAWENLLIQKMKKKMACQVIYRVLEQHRCCAKACTIFCTDKQFTYKACEKDYSLINMYTKSLTCAAYLVCTIHSSKAWWPAINVHIDLFFGPFPIHWKKLMENCSGPLPSMTWSIFNSSKQNKKNPSHLHILSFYVHTKFFLCFMILGKFNPNKNIIRSTIYA